jgi:hypothetical protein
MSSGLEGAATTVDTNLPNIFNYVLIEHYLNTATLIGAELGIRLRGEDVLTFINRF